MLKKRVFIILTVVLISTLALTACGGDPWQDIGSEENPIIFVAVPSGETERVLAGFDAVADLVYADTGLVMEPFVATSYTAAIEAMCSDPPQAHMGSLATFAYILAAQKGCAETALVATRYGNAFYNGQFLVAVGSGLEKLEDLAGKNWCRPYANSTSGDIIPSIMLSAVGIDTTTDLGEIIDAGSHEAAAVGLYSGDCDFATTYIDARSREEENYPDIMDKTTVIEVMPDIPNDGIQFHTDFPAELKAKLVAAFLALFESEEGAAAMEEAYQWGGMEEHGDDFYEPFRQILDAAGLSAEDIAKRAD
jgi:phosphonate transport system substrate-binding protein